MNLFRIHPQRYINADRISTITVEGHCGDFQVMIYLEGDRPVTYRRGLKDAGAAELALASLAHELAGQEAGHHRQLAMERSGY